MRTFPFPAPFRRISFIVFALSLAVLSVPLFADDDSVTPQTDTEVTTDDQSAAGDEQADVVVTATRRPDDRLRAPPFVVNVSRAMIEAAGKSGISEAVAENAGVTLAAYGYRGGLESLWLRGATGTRVLVLLDGVPTNNILDGQMSLSLIPPEAVERVEVIQGGMSLLYGSQAVGGVINIITRQGEAGMSFLRAGLTASSYLPQGYNDGTGTVSPQAEALFDGMTTSLAAGHAFGPVGIFASGNFTWLRNEYYYDNASITYQRDNAALLSGGGLASVTVPWETGAVGVKGIYVRQNAGVPGSLSYLTTQADQTDERLQVMASYRENRFFTDILSLNAKFSFTSQRRIYEDPSWPSDNTVTGFFGELSQEAAVADWLSLLYGGTLAYDMIDGDMLGERDRLSGSVFLAAPLFLGDVLRIYPAGRLDLSSDYGNELTYGLGASLLLSDTASLKLSLAKSFRAPNFAELYYPFMSNPDLKPERGWHADLGFSLNTPRVKLESALFARYMEDEIQNDATWTPQNIAYSFYPGAEIQASVEFIEHFFIDASYTFIYSFNLSGGRTLADDVRVPRVPLHEGHLYLSYRTKNTVIRVGGDVKGDCFTNDSYAVTLPAHVILNANCRQSLTDFLILTVALDNILNTQYQVMYDYPMPGISLRWGLELNL
jgi:vitamin B12 transporter